MDTLFSHVNIVTMNEQMTLWQDAFVGVTDGKIAYMAKKPPEEQPKKIIDATGMVLMPGLINCHTHLPMYLLRGYADDLNLQDWLEHYIFPREDRLDGRAVKAAATLAIAEALRFGTTSVSDMYYFCDEICQAVAESGIKANISRGTSMFLGDDFCFDTFPACRELVELKDKWHNYDNGRIKRQGGYAAAGKAACVRGALPGEQPEARLRLRGRARHGQGGHERVPRHGLGRVQQQSGSF